jgi:uncharacterized protein
MRRNLVCLAAGTMFAVLLAPISPGADLDDAWKRELLAWRTQRAKGLLAPEGWMALVGLDWLKAGANSFGSTPDNSITVPSVVTHLGVLQLDHGTVKLMPPAGSFPTGLAVDGHVPVTGQKLVTDESEHPSKITAGTLTMVVIRRGERLGLRTWDSRAPTIVQFHGLRWYEPNPRYRVEARWTPYHPPKAINLTTIIGTNEKAEVPGVAEFTLEGKTLRLEPAMESPGEKQLFFILRDATSKTDTYPASRFLYTAMPDHGLSQPGKLVLDFNRAQNPPCAYTAFATCPLPQKGNMLPVAIAAGEKRYHD